MRRLVTHGSRRTTFVLGVALAGVPLVGDGGPYDEQLRLFREWAHSPITLILAAALLGFLVVAVFTPFGRRIVAEPPSDTLRAYVLLLCALVAVDLAVDSILVTLATMIALWGGVGWYLVRWIGSLAPRAGGGLLWLVSPRRRRERREAQAAEMQTRERGGELERTLNELVQERERRSPT